MIRRLFAFAFVGLIVSLGGVATAQSPGAAPSSCETLRDCYLLGQQAYRTKDYSAAVLHWAKGCEMGHGQSCFYAGEASKETGDRPALREFYKLACEGNFEEGCLPYTRSLLNERDGPVDYETAIKQLEQGCSQPGINQAAACQSLASGYSVGKYGLPLDNTQAEALARKSCDLGDGFGCLLAAQYED